ncbi:beta family protein [Mangrovihabitans endophyticus]|nr:beta family protein [Mangrovihabitans endophyticus]
MRASYRPFLRPRRGELTALHHLDPVTAAATLPILEMHGERNVARLLTTLHPRTGAVGMDFGDLPDDPDPLRSPPLDLAEHLIDLDIAMIPVLRAHDTGRRLVEHGLAARMHLRRGILRLQPHVDATNPVEADAVTRRVMRGSDLDCEQLDLVIDLAETACRAHADAVEERARRVLRWARSRPWRSVSVASGAMPPNLDGLPVDRAVPLGRLDARVFQHLEEEDVDFADYGVTSPVRRRDAPYHRQLPTLRYTAEHAWWIYRWARRGGRSDDRCRDLCRTLTQSPQWPAEGARFSWGDAQIARRSRIAHGGGSANGWIAWSTSHHLTHVVRMLHTTAT